VAAARLGIKDVYGLNGPSGIAALAFGTETVRPVHKIVGPGSVPVTLAQQLVQVRGCSVVGGLGPTDSLIVADESADVLMLAADLVNEAEHGPDSSAVLISTSRSLLEAVAQEVERQLVLLPEPRQSYARTSIGDNGGLILAESWAQVMEIANDYAPEHLQIATCEPRKVLEDLKFAGTALLGQWSTFACSNFVIGTPATLPTTGFAKRGSGVTAHTFLNQISVAEVGESEFWSISGAVKAFAGHEGFPAHAASVLVRERARQAG
jgi:histidinol dehydrogenase